MESKILEIHSKYKRFRLEASGQKKSVADPVKAIYTRIEGLIIIDNLIGDW